MPATGEPSPASRPSSRARDLLVVVLAAGDGKRMRSSRPKVLHELAGQPLISYPLSLARQLGAARVAVVHAPAQREAIADIAGAADMIAQRQRLGTGHALNQVPQALRHHREVLVLYGDVPLLTPGTLRRLLAARRRGDQDCVLLAAEMVNPQGYGRVVGDRSQARIVEQVEATPEEAAVRLVNTGVCVFKAASLWPALRRLRKSSRSGEYYLTDVFGTLPKRAVITCDAEEALGVNDRWQLAEAERVVRGRRVRELALSGVTIVDPGTTYIDASVTVEPDARIEPFSFLRGSTSIGAGSRIGPFAEITDCRIGRGCTIGRSHLVLSTVEDGVEIGPFNKLRAGSVVAHGSRIGSFAEIKNTVVGPDSDVHHFSYLGDAVIGRRVNIGAGTVTANYDGTRKSQTVIGDGVFIGSDSTLVAPVRVGDDAYTAAGSVITRDVEPGSLAIERNEQRAVAGWGRRRRKGAEKSGK
ncbi:MAG TPA: bifunctional UDP-N-acetylglucosamine diphosphorylase/glucosamine-1-phosphate N-acetyltransferase GlmU [Candidatus Dormibacteraeota bacterium]|nr:bifunctional UDP-N-acetylglucosamine diphosphorylase/glucosamine-1-phosphate N-acetyltransferase GlmU [Candidatus Dormibacteraeota bacterium]